MSDLDEQDSPCGGRVSQGNDAMCRARSILETLRKAGASYDELEAEFGISKGVLYKILNRADYWSDQSIERVVGERWHSLTARLVLPSGYDRGNVPMALAVGYELRRCPVTDDWFLALPGLKQKYAPGLSAAVKREARRNLAHAREKFDRLGDWGL